MATDIEDLHRAMVINMASREYASRKEYDKEVVVQRKIFRIQPRKTALISAYNTLIDAGEIERNESYELYALRNLARSASGVVVVTLFTSAYPAVDGKHGRFDCAYDCHYCPDEPGQPRSYLSTEPGVKRAIEHEYDCVRQFNARCGQLSSCGHPIDKIEILVLGGTWSSYPIEYREEFIRDAYYAANMHGEEPLHRERLSLSEERTINETAKARIIGITLETRPDQISHNELRDFRRYGCTRVQIGVQHTNDDILRKINRRCYNRHTIRAIRLLKDAGFKIDIHLMPDLPGASPELDREMFNFVLTSPDLQVDQWKIYPCEVTPFTKIKQWYEEGSYKPYAESDPDAFMEVLLDVKAKVHPWIRLNRVIRDIPNESILGGNQVTHLRNILRDKLIERGTPCKCIRCREVKADERLNIENAQLTTRRYESSGGIEYYISFEDPNTNPPLLYGHLRLRINSGETPIFEELRGCALIRELHVYGRVIEVNDATKDGHAQHSGFGKRMLRHAEHLAVTHKLSKIAVISGDGVKPYYRKQGYVDIGDYLIKDISATRRDWTKYLVPILFVIIGFLLPRIIRNFF